MIDRDVLAELQKIVGGRREDLEEIISEFLADVPVQLAAMAEAARAGETNRLRLGAHSLKSNARDVGAMHLAECCAALEADLQTAGAVPDPSARVAELQAIWPEVRSALDLELRRGLSGS